MLKTLNILKNALREDIGKEDITTKLLPFKKSFKVKAIIRANQRAILCGVEIAREVFRLLDKDLKIKILLKDGQKLKAKDIVLEIEGAPQPILMGERTALNFLAHLSGIATKTYQFVKIAKPYRVKILDTRKTTPGLRTLEKYAVRIGGGYNHRMGLWDQVLLKDNHIKVYTSSTADTLKELIRTFKKKTPKGLKLEVEVKNLKDFTVALKESPDIIMLDNMKPPQLKKAVKLKKKFFKENRKAPLLEASGKINLKNLSAFRDTGIDMISIGALTHSVEAVDFSLEIK